VLSLLLALWELFVVFMAATPMKFPERRRLINGFAQSSSTVGVDLLAISSNQHRLILVETILEVSHTVEADVSDGYPFDSEWPG